MTAIAWLAAVAGVLAAAGFVDAIVALRRPRQRRDSGVLQHPEDPRRSASATVRDRFDARAIVPAALGPRAGALMSLLAAVGRRFPARAPSGLGRRIAAAGLDATVADLMALKAGAAVGGLIVAISVGPRFPGALGWLLLLGGPLTSFLAPDAWMRRRAVRRAGAMERQLDDVLELLRVAVEAGLTVPRALAEVGRRHPGVLAAELRRAAALMELGMGQRRAVEVLVHRCPTPGVVALAGALGRAERHGAPLGEALAAQAAQARARRARQSIEVAARAAPKIQLIVALLLVPSAMLLMAAAMLPALAWR